MHTEGKDVLVDLMMPQFKVPARQIVEVKVKRLGSGSMGKCGLCKKYFTKGEQWHFQDMTGNPNNPLKEKQHWDCERPFWKPY